MLTRNVERNDVLKSSDVITERRPKAEVGSDAAARGHAVGMQMRKQLRAGQALRVADLAKPDLVQRDEQCHADLRSRRALSHLRGKALDSGTEGDIVTVLNLQSKRTVSGAVIGRDQVAISIATPRLLPPPIPPPRSEPPRPAAPVSVAASRNTAQTSPKAE